MAILTPRRPATVEQPQRGLVLGLIIQLVIVLTGLGWTVANTLGQSSPHPSVTA